MNGGTKDEGLEYKWPRRLKCDRWNFQQQQQQQQQQQGEGGEEEEEEEEYE
jgi:hypothetical protein